MHLRRQLVMQVEGNNRQKHQSRWKEVARFTRRSLQYQCRRAGQPYTPVSVGRPCVKAHKQSHVLAH